MSEYIESGRVGGKMRAMINKIKHTRGLIIVPCYSGKHAKSLLEYFHHEGLKAHITTKIQKGVMRRPYTSRRSIQIEIFN